jgi:hypothetical protein
MKMCYVSYIRATRHVSDIAVQRRQRPI